MNDCRDVIEHYEYQVQCLEDRIEKLEAARDGAYTERNRLVAFLASIYPSGVKKTAIPGWDEAWHGCVYIDLPTGQASWHFHDSEAHLFAHLPPYDGEWDGHTTEEKYERLFLAASHAKQTDELLADYMKFADALMPHIKKQNDRIEQLEAALLNIVATFGYGSSRGAYKARYFRCLDIAKAELKHLGLGGTYLPYVKYRNKIQALEGKDERDI